MKTPKEKSKELVENYYKQLPQWVNKKDAKQCALICIDEIIDAIDWHYFETPNIQLEYWKSVKIEIEEL